jgi:hypothetical protein
MEAKIMSNRTGRILRLFAIALPMLAGCAANSTQVHTKAAADLSCDLPNVNVRLAERSYLGVTRYEATGCGETRSYECRARFYSLGLPLGQRTCKRAGGSPEPVIDLGGVAF